jgi:uncharacterized protein (TIGR03437 family)
VTGQLVTSAYPAAAGEIISIYCTGLGAVNPAPPETELPAKVYIANASAKVTYSGLAPGFVGVYQINAQIPASPPSGVQNLQVSAGGVSSNTVTVAIR